MQEKNERNEAPAIDKANFLWNDVAKVNDENCCFIICKTMLQLPKDKGDIANLDDAKVEDIWGEFAQGKLNGKIVLAVSYTDEEEQKEELTLEVPFIIDYQGDMSRGSILEENYATAQRADSRHILLETVTSVPKKNIPTRSLEKVGNFERQDRIALPGDWPDMEQIIGVNVVYDQPLFRAEDDKPILDMTGHIGIIYAQNTQRGEKVVYYQTQESVSINLEQPLVEAEAGYYSLSAQLINEREVALQSFNHLYGEKLAEDAVNAEIKEEPQETADTEERTAQEEPAVNADEEPLTEQEEEAPVEEQQANQSQPEAVATALPKRVNRRESLERHMHSLDRGVKTSHIVRNIEINK